MTSAGLKCLALWLLLLATADLARSAASPADDHFAATERAHYAALCRARKNLDSCSDAVRWSPGDPEMVVALADALFRARRLPEAVRDYRRAKALDPEMRGLDARIRAAEAQMASPRAPRNASGHPSAGKAAEKRYSNLDPEAQSH